MRVRLDRYEAANRSMGARTLVLFVFGGLAAFVAALGLFFGMAFLVMPDPGEGNGIWARRSGVFVGVFFGIAPAVASSLMLTYAARQRARFRKLGELVAIARQAGGWVTPQDVARGMGTTHPLAHRLIVEATTLGLIEEGPAGRWEGPPPPTPAAPTAPPAFVPPPAVASNGDIAHASTVASSKLAASKPAAEPFVPGAVIAETYRVEAPLGRGGMGVVFSARHLRTGRRYAIKSILGGARADEAALRRFEREATAASLIGHPGIVQVHDFNVTADGVFYLVMDLLEGETLESRLERGPLPFAEVQRITDELGSALAAAHDRGLIHRDIKPSNIFLARASGAPERCVLVDFGLVKPLAESSLLTSTGAVLGTPMYMSPEQARGEILDRRSDIYSLAAVVFEALTGAPPFLDRTTAAVYARLLGEPPPRASLAGRNVPRAVDEVLVRALAKDRDARYPDARAFAEAFGRITEESPVTARLGVAG